MISHWLSETVKSKDRQYNKQWKTKNLKTNNGQLKHYTELKIEQHEPYLDQ
jgi:hypothetical protein